MIALAALLGLTAIIMIHRWVFDDWTGRHDLLGFFIPWYGLLGDRLAAGDIPGWNPHLFGGSPFAGDPESGWMYLPAMLMFTFLPIINAIKGMILLQLLIAGTTTYAFSRVLGMGALAALLSAVVYEFGPFLYVQTDCCTVSSQLSAWIPMGLLGIELALQARSRLSRVAAWFLAGFAISQMLAGWVGQGAVYGVLIMGAYVAFRTFLVPPDRRWTIADSFRQALINGPAIIIIGVGIAAAGLLPRLAVNAQSNNPGGTYENIRGAGDEAPYQAWTLFRALLTSEFGYRAVSIGGLAFVLGLIAVIGARRHYAMPFFAGLALVIGILSMGNTPLHSLFYAVLPGFQALHEHGPRRIMWMSPIAPAMLAGIGLQVLPEFGTHRLARWLVFLPLPLIVAIERYVRANGDVGFGAQTYVVAALTTLAAALVVFSPSIRNLGAYRQDITFAAAGVLIALAFVVPHAWDIARSIKDPDGLTQPNNLWQHQPVTQAAVAVNLSRMDPGGAGEFLQQKREVLQPFRYVGYSGRGYDPAPSHGYPTRRMEPVIMAQLANGRPFRLGLEQIQGYNPLLLGNWYTYMGVLNSYVQNYHYTDLLDSGAKSPLLDMLNVRYLLIDATIPPDREDIVAMTQGREEVFRNDLVAIYENPEAYPRAWIVSNVRSAPAEDALFQLNSGAVDGRYTAFVEGEAPSISQIGSTPGTVPGAATTGRAGVGTVTVTEYAADEMTFRTESESEGFMVVSEVYEEGWKAFLDGAEVEIRETNGLFRGIVLPAGEHEVEMRYEPRSMTIGLWSTGLFSLAGIGVWLAALVSWLQGIRRSSGVEPDVVTEDAPALVSDDEPPPPAVSVKTGASSPPAPKIVFKRRGG